MFWGILSLLLVNDSNGHIPLPSSLESFADKICATKLRSQTKLEYSIFRGTSALRDHSIVKQIEQQQQQQQQQKHHQYQTKSIIALQLVLNNKLDAAHEVILGVLPTNIVDAEYAATHPGSGWIEKHPLSNIDDYIHSIIHRMEGNYLGEGNHTGWENAKYWIAGGPKQHYSKVINKISEADNNYYYHPVFTELIKLCHKYTPTCLKEGLIPTSDKIHSILADGGTKRNVYISAGCWDPFRFIDLLSSSTTSQEDDTTSSNTELQNELNFLLESEMRLLIQYCSELKEVDSL